MILFRWIAFPYQNFEITVPKMIWVKNSDRQKTAQIKHFRNSHKLERWVHQQKFYLSDQMWMQQNVPI